MLRALRTIALLALTLAPAVSEAAPACPECVSAGAARVALTVPVGTPLAGYGDRARRLAFPDVLGRHPHAFWFRPSEGSRDPLAVRALVLEGGGRRLTWLTVDLIAVDRAFTQRVARGLTDAGLPPGALIVSASHTHSGPGAFMESGVFGFLAIDRFDGEVRDALVTSLVEAARRADRAKVPARVASAAVKGPDLTVPRLKRPTRPVDREVVVVKIVSDAGEPIAAVWNYAIHGTTLAGVNLRFSADVMGAASREIERTTGVPALFVNGAVADVSPSRHGEIESDHAGRELAAAVRSAWEAAEPAMPAPLALAETRVALAPPYLSLRNCTGSWVPRWLTAPLGKLLPGDAELIGARLGDVAWVTVPGELQSLLGETVKRAGRPALPRVFVAGLSNDYLGYFLAAPDYDRVTYVACATLYGPSAGPLITDAAEQLIRQLAVAGGR
ncbi:MAG TPA: neutral/alkaline non-lysosomal ceramidase N-terminal domain-containing protein [Candidatus Acidoferrum sp.]|nr:neutral/alkaline non-lysosomal ceramidase N-terminal domain-containing protein [Candidatus Acidoferrum sp.]